MQRTAPANSRERRVASQKSLGLEAGSREMAGTEAGAAVVGIGRDRRGGRPRVWWICVLRQYGGFHPCRSGPSRKI
jgi:hypothetical protein